ncbi:MAG: type 1 glutamine amidotransferase [Gammaproteobacteria bacterium]|nr:type 1 glutamine amidotransferase [Gammaproteobacteria bacterium]
MSRTPVPRLLLLQIRHDPRVRQEDFESFVRYCGVDAGQIDILNVFDSHEIGPAALVGYDALLVGGASEASVLEPQRYPAVPACIALLKHCIEVDFPVFASCFGFQLAVLVLGGEIVRDESDYEMGSLPISLRPAAAEDLLFRDVPDGFHAIAVHRERSLLCPPGATELAYTRPCCHAFRVNNKRFWACQFHPEVDRATLVSRLTIYKQAYTDGDHHLDEILSAAVETPESNALMRKFVDRVLR